MKKLAFSFMVFACFNVFAQMKNIAISPFELGGNILSDSEAEAITELYSTFLTDTGRVHVVDHAKFIHIIKELNFKAADFADISRLSLLANKAKIDAVNRGKIMKIGKNFYISASFIDAKSAQVLSSAKVTLASLDDVENALGRLAREIVQGLSIKVGDIGPAGGIIFYIEGEKGFECSEKLAQCNWTRAKTVCSSYTGGEKDDWHLPTKDELDLIYINLRRVNKIEQNGLYWSCTANDVYDAWAKNFATGEQVGVELMEKLNVRAVRVFSLSDF